MKRTSSLRAAIKKEEAFQDELFALMEENNDNGNRKAGGLDECPQSPAPPPPALPLDDPELFASRPPALSLDGRSLRRSDLRTIPPHSPPQEQPRNNHQPELVHNNDVLHPPPQQKKEKKKREKNPYFQDVEKTGTWGNMTLTEIYLIPTIVFLIVFGTVIAIFAVSFAVGDGRGSPLAVPQENNVTTTTTVPVYPSRQNVVTISLSSPQAKLSVLLNHLQGNEFVDSTTLFQDLNDYIGLVDDDQVSPPVRAMSWILYEDDTSNHIYSEKNITLFHDRYALALFYYATNGQHWINGTHWLTEAHVCTWVGIICDRFHTTIQQVNLFGNNLTGTLPQEINLFQSITSLVLSNNGLRGELPQLAIGSLPHLTILFLDNNQFTGQVSTDLRQNGVLETLIIQGNNLTGSFPRSFCPRNTGPDILSEFALDCDKISCRCCEVYNCF